MSNKSTRREMAAAIIKPDAVREILVQQIEDDIKAIGLLVVGWFSLKIPESLVPQIYPDRVESPLFASTIWSITSGPSVLMLVDGEDSHKKLSTLKGKMNSHGIRKKYNVFSREELVKMGYEGKKLHDKLFENRIHTTDDQNETDRLLSLLLTSQQLESFRIRYPELYSRVKRYRSIVLLNHGCK